MNNFRDNFVDFNESKNYFEYFLHTNYSSLLFIADVLVHFVCCDALWVACDDHAYGMTVVWEKRSWGINKRGWGI